MSLNLNYLKKVITLVEVQVKVLQGFHVHVHLNGDTMLKPVIQKIKRTCLGKPWYYICIY